MIDKQTQALKRLTKKLSALRTTLRKDERDLLDQLILGASADVAGHALTSAISTEAMTSRPAEARKAEVEAHRMDTGAITPRPSSAKTPKPAEARKAEVEAHRMAGAISPRIIFDADNKAYKVRD